MGFGLRWRDQLPPVVVDEFENLINDILSHFSASHDEDGGITPEAIEDIVEEIVEELDLTGPAGPPGQGRDGDDGRDGRPGLQGLPGKDAVGPRGFDGEDGEPGFPIPGPQGLPGIMGPQGFRGEDGEDAWPFSISSQLVTSEFTTTSTGNIDDLDFGTANLIRMNNASLATIRGLKAGLTGQRVTIVSIGAGQVNLSHQDTGDGTATNRLINYITSGVTPLAPGSGTAEYEYDGTTGRWRLISHDQGAAIEMAFSAGNYTTSGAETWTVASGDQVSLYYRVVGRQLYYYIDVEDTSVSAPVARLRLTLPNSYTTGGPTAVPTTFNAFDNNVQTMAYSYSVTGLTYMQFLRADQANWAAATDNTDLYGTGIVELA